MLSIATVQRKEYRASILLRCVIFGMELCTNHTVSLFKQLCVVKVRKLNRHCQV